MKTLTTLAAGWLLTAAATALGAEAKPGPEVWREPVTGMEFVRVPKGCYAMGNPRAVVLKESLDGKPVEIPFNDELPKHEACIDAFWLGRHEVRVGDWQQVMGDAVGPAEVPVAGVSWRQAVEFARKLGERGGGKHRYRLPTEAEWEYACRAGAKEEIVAERAELQGKAWYAVEPAGKKEAAQPVGRLPPNAFGLYDMLGNVWEWVLDTYQPDAYTRHTLYGPVTRAPAPQRVIRGASFRSLPIHVRCARRGHYDPALALPVIGLRLVRID